MIRTGTAASRSGGTATAGEVGLFTEETVVQCRCLSLFTDRAAAEKDREKRTLTSYKVLCLTAEGPKFGPGFIESE